MPSECTGTKSECGTDVNYCGEGVYCCGYFDSETFKCKLDKEVS